MHGGSRGQHSTRQVLPGLAGTAQTDLPSVLAEPVLIRLQAGARVEGICHRPPLGLRHENR